MSGGARRRTLRTRRFKHELADLFRNVDRGKEALSGFEDVVSRLPEQGMAAPGHPDCCVRPLHTDAGAFLIVYVFTAETVTLLSIRRIPSGPFF